MYGEQLSISELSSMFYTSSVYVIQKSEVLFNQQIIIKPVGETTWGRKETLKSL